MSKIVFRHNFETNSSSMHSLSFRRAGGEYSVEELKRSEVMADDDHYDAIITLKEGRTVTAEDVHNEGWIWNNKMRIWDSDLDLTNSAMQVISSFRDKLIYALATAAGYKYRGWGNRIEEIKNVFSKLLPDVKLNADIEEDDLRYHSVGVNQYLLYPFLKENGITIEEFLTNTKYIVIVNYPEYEKMKWLNMVDESQVESVYRNCEDGTHEMKIEDGIWKLTADDIYFGRSPFRVLGTVEGKARYALADGRSENLDEILAIMQEVYPEMKSIELPTCWYEPNKKDTGYCEDCAIPANLPLRDFILDKRYVVISDGDEYCIWNNFKRTKLFNHEEYPEETVNEDY